MYITCTNLTCSDAIVTFDHVTRFYYIFTYRALIENEDCLLDLAQDYQCSTAFGIPQGDDQPEYDYVNRDDNIQLQSMKYTDCPAYCSTQQK